MMFSKFAKIAKLSLFTLTLGASLIGCGSSSSNLELAVDTSADETVPEKKTKPNGPVVTDTVKLARGRTIGK